MNNNFSSFLGIEYDTEEAKKAAKIELHDTHVLNCDFHKFCLSTDRRFDLVIGNPPFIRYQYYDEALQSRAADIFKLVNLKYSSLRMLGLHS